MYDQQFQEDTDFKENRVGQALKDQVQTNSNQTSVSVSSNVGEWMPQNQNEPKQAQIGLISQQFYNYLSFLKMTNMISSVQHWAHKYDTQKYLKPLTVIGLIQSTQIVPIGTANQMFMIINFNSLLLSADNSRLFTKLQIYLDFQQVANLKKVINQFQILQHLNQNKNPNTMGIQISTNYQVKNGHEKKLSEKGTTLIAFTYLKPHFLNNQIVFRLTEDSNVFLIYQKLWDQLQPRTHLLNFSFSSLNFRDFLDRQDAVNLALHQKIKIQDIQKVGKQADLLPGSHGHTIFGVISQIQEVNNGQIKNDRKNSNKQYKISLISHFHQKNPKWIGRAVVFVHFLDISQQKLQKHFGKQQLFMFRNVNLILSGKYFKYKLALTDRLDNSSVVKISNQIFPNDWECYFPSMGLSKLQQYTNLVLDRNIRKFLVSQLYVDFFAGKLQCSKCAAIKKLMTSPNSDGTLLLADSVPCHHCNEKHSRLNVYAKIFCQDDTMQALLNLQNALAIKFLQLSDHQVQQIKNFLFLNGGNNYTKLFSRYGPGGKPDSPNDLINIRRKLKFNVVTKCIAAFASMDIQKNKAMMSEQKKKMAYLSYASDKKTEIFYNGFIGRGKTEFQQQFKRQNNAYGNNKRSKYRSAQDKYYTYPNLKVLRVEDVQTCGIQACEFIKEHRRSAKNDKA